MPYGVSMRAEVLQFQNDFLSHLVTNTLVAVQVSIGQDTRLSLLLSPSATLYYCLGHCVNAVVWLLKLHIGNLFIVTTDHAGVLRTYSVVHHSALVVICPALVCAAVGI